MEEGHVFKRSQSISPICGLVVQAFQSKTAIIACVLGFRLLRSLRGNVAFWFALVTWTCTQFRWLDELFVFFVVALAISSRRDFGSSAYQWNKLEPQKVKFVHRL